MRVFLKVCLIVVGVAVLLPLAALAWLFFDSRGLPDFRSLANFTPSTLTQVSDPCLRTNEPVFAASYSGIGPVMRAALTAAEGGVDYPGPLESFYLALTKQSASKPILSYQIVKTMFCQSSADRSVNHEIDSLRLTVQLERHYSHRELFTIFANRVYFAEGQYGVVAAARHFFHKEPSELDIEEAALLAGLPRAPVRYSPRLHPDLAVQRRNQVIDEMVAAQAISASDGVSAKSAPLTISVTEQR